MTSIATILPPDKALHVIAGFVIIAVCHALTISDPICLAASIATGIGKEVYDKLHPANHTFEVLDAASTSVGGLIAYSITFQF